ncbi:Putative T-box protein 7 [Caenorhabditis elegans]|nr:Putative T-box protein 7 [Caenorhabditis elegans]CTQ86630.1 Putative T-box protein 7 [Caenorhabditis elegans]|eukprot:NP_001299930.1 Putative T-box protein 7 [Caenorhabditis elegans]
MSLGSFFSFPASSAFFDRKKDDGVIDNPNVELVNRNLWSTFLECGTEMIITKKGRRMFPLVKLKLSGLDKNSNYTIIMEMISVDKLRYKFWNGNWIVAGVGEHHPLPTCFVHPQSPRSGEWWMTDGVDFKMAKLSNNPFNNDGHIVLNSMHRYNPRFHIVRADSSGQPILASLKTFSFKETEFIAVTAYQNDVVTKCKIDNNPFAKGFRNIDTVRKRKMNQIISTPPASEDEEPEVKRTKSEIEAVMFSDPKVPQMSLQLISQWQEALLSTIVQIPITNQKSSSERKSGFGVVDLLGSS